MGLINRRGLGTQPSSSSTSMRGRHNRGGGPRHIGGGGGGGGGGGRNRIPNTGLYRGQAGKTAANQNPEQFFRTAVNRVGTLDYSGTPIGDFSESFIQKLLDDYLGAQASKQRLDPIKYLKQTYGAGFQGKKARTFNPGDLAVGGEGSALDAAFTPYYSNTNTPAYLTGQIAQAGGHVPGGGNDQFARYVQDTYIPGVEADTAAARAADPTVNVSDLIAGRDLLGEARRRFLARGDSMRQPGVANASGRWSWWD
jgi:hypothetical protein